MLIKTSTTLYICQHIMANQQEDVLQLTTMLCCVCDRISETIKIFLLHPTKNSAHTKMMPASTNNTVNNFSTSRVWRYPQKASSLVLLQVEIVASIVLHHHFTLQLAVIRHRLRTWRPWYTSLHLSSPINIMAVLQLF